MEDEIIVRIAPHSEGGLYYDIYVDPDDVELPEDSDDGGMCTSGMHTAECDGFDNEDCNGCESEMAKPHSRKDWENAFDMLKDQALNILFPNERK